MKEYDLLKIFDSMHANDINEVIIKDAGRTYEIRRGTTKQALAAQTYASVPASVAPAAVSPVIDAAPSGAASAYAPNAAISEDTNTGFYEIKSPLVGTFYAASTPDAPPIVEVGSRVTKGMTLCIVEAMKNFNEIECDVDGVVREVCAKNGDIIEYGKVLFKIETK